MECTGDTRSTVRTAARTALAAAVAALVTGGMIAAGQAHAAGPQPTTVGGPTSVVALPKSIGVSNRAW